MCYSVWKVQKHFVFSDGMLKQLRKTTQTLKRLYLLEQQVKVSKLRELYQKKLSSFWLQSLIFQIIDSNDDYNYQHHYNKNMYSGLYANLYPNNYLPHYFTAPAYNFGNFIFSPIAQDAIPLFPINPFYSSQNGPQIEPNLTQRQQLDKNDINLQSSSKTRKENIRVQTYKQQNKNTNKRRNKKTKQKDERNVVSNLLKIFFKSLLDLHKWDDHLKKLIQRYEVKTTLKRFHIWVTSFSINYRNYIKSKEIKELLATQNCRPHQMMFRVLLKRFVQSQGLSHSLTARRIGKESMRRHVEGLRQIGSLITSSQS